MSRNLDSMYNSPDNKIRSYHTDTYGMNRERNTHMTENDEYYENDYYRNRYYQDDYDRDESYLDDYDMDYDYDMDTDDEYMNDEYFESDRNYMKSLYPETSKRIQKLVDDECDKMEYDGSMMYEEYPSKETIEKIVDKIYMIMEKDNNPAFMQEIQAQENDLQSQQYLIPAGGGWLRDSIQVLLLNELFGRRRRRFPRRYRYFRPPFRRYRSRRYWPYSSYVPYRYRYY